MIPFEHFILDNGLNVYVHEDTSSPMAVVNVLYNVGSKDENPSKTGFAHLFEHLMFGGSINIPDYDTALQKVGGVNNAFTSPDLTNYYISLPSVNIETALWLESDRMLSLAFTPESLEVQRKVVVEEFKQRYLNQPYGDTWLKLRPLCYKKHPYSWATIGKEISHIENASLDDVKEFFFTYYRPCNAHLVLAGNIKVEEAKRLANKWFSSIPAGEKYLRNLPKEEKQTEARKLVLEEDVPSHALFKAYKMCGKTEPAFFASDMLSDMLGGGKSSRLYTEMVQEKRLFTQISAHVSGSVDPGLFVVSGKVAKGVSIEEADAILEASLSAICAQGFTEKELQKIKNQTEAQLAFSEVELLNRAMNIAFYAQLGIPEEVNQVYEKMEKVTLAQIQEVAKEVLKPEVCSTLYYKSKQSSL